MGNCLKTQLKQVVNNNNLDLLGTLEVDLLPNNGTSSYLTIDSGTSSCTLYKSGAVKFYSDSAHTTEVSTPLVINGSTTLYTLGIEEGDKVKISNKYDIKNLSFKGSPAWTQNQLEVDYLSSLVTLDIMNQKLAFDIEDLAEINKNVEILTLIYDTFVTGNIEAFAEKLLPYKESGTRVAIWGYNTEIKLNGQKFFTDYNYRNTFMEIKFNVGTIVCKFNNVDVASYDGSTWSYA